MQDEGDDSPQTLFGDLVALGAAAFYGLYTTTIRVQVWSRVASPFRIVVKYVIGTTGS